MKAKIRCKPIALGTCLCVTLAQLKMVAQTLDPWRTVGQFQLATNRVARGRATGVDTDGSVFTAGYAMADSSKVPRGVINRSRDGGRTWVAVDQFLKGKQTLSGVYNGFASAPMGHELLACGNANDAAGAHWLVRESTDGGATWSTTDFFQYSAGKLANCQAMAVDSSGNEYAVGYALNEVAKQFWITRRKPAQAAEWTTVDALSGSSDYVVARAAAAHPTYGLFVVGDLNSCFMVRRSRDNGISWVTVDTYPEAGASSARAVSITKAGVVYVAGSAATGDKTYWAVRRSVDGGETWVTVDLFRYKGQDSLATGVTVDASGVVYVAGQATGCSSPSHWLVRKGTPTSGGMDWQLSDDYQLVPGLSASAAGIVWNPRSGLYAIGVGFASGKVHWITRKLAVN